MVALRQVGIVSFALSALVAPTFAQQANTPDAQGYTLTTKDGVQLAITYYPSRERVGTSQAKQVTPVVLLHDFQDTRAVFASLAQRLQSPPEVDDDGNALPPGKTFAVVTVDLRGHGESTRREGALGYEQSLAPAKFEVGDFFAMASMDMEAVRSFLVGKNDAGELNLNKLCVLGSGMGASVAVIWAANDWTAPPLAVGKQGQDVRGLVLISPRWSTHGLSLQDAMKVRPLKQNAAWMLVYGNKDSKVAADARRIVKQLERYHPDRPTATNEPPRGLEDLPWPTSLQGSTLLSQGGPDIEEKIVEFLTINVANRHLPWLARRSRLP